MERLIVAVSPFYGGEDWTDEATGITFKKDERGMAAYSIPADADLKGIRKSIRLNSLILVEGVLPEEVLVEEESLPVKEVLVEEPVQELVEEVKEEVEEEKPKRTPKRKK